MNYKNQLLLEELALKIINSWDSIQDYRGWTYEKEMSSWRVEVYDYIIDSTTTQEHLDFVLSYIHDFGPAKCFLEINELVVQYRLHNKSSIIDIISNLFRGHNAEEKIRTNSSISIGRNSDVDIETGFDTSSERISGDTNEGPNLG